MVRVFTQTRATRLGRFQMRLAPLVLMHARLVHDISPIRLTLQLTLSVFKYVSCPLSAALRSLREMGFVTVAQDLTSHCSDTAWKVGLAKSMNPSFIFVAQVILYVTACMSNKDGRVELQCCDTVFIVWNAAIHRFKNALTSLVVYWYSNDRPTIENV